MLSSLVKWTAVQCSPLTNSYTLPLSGSTLDKYWIFLKVFVSGEGSGAVLCPERFLIGFNGV